MTGLCFGGFVWFGVFHILSNVIEGISLRACCFDEGILNVRVGCDRFSSKSVSVFVAYNTCPCSCLNFKGCGLSQLVCFAWETGFWCTCTIYLIIFLTVILKVLFFNITQRFSDSLVQLSIFLIDFCWDLWLSSHARLEAFVIQTKLKLKDATSLQSIYKNTCVGFDLVKMNGWWWLVDCFGNGLEDISLDVVAVEVWVWELLFSLVHWG